MRWNLFNNWRPNRRPAGPPRRRLAVEPLEARDLLAAQPLLFSIIPGPANSFLTASGDVRTSLTGGTVFPIQQQGPGSLTTSYTGTINTSFDPVGAPRLQFLQSGTAADAATSGNWQPQPGGGAGTAPADYGARAVINVLFLSATANIAVRNLVAAVSTPGLADLVGAGPAYTFASDQTVTITGGTADYRVTGFVTAEGSESLAGSSAANTSPTDGTFQDLGDGRYLLVVPVRLTIEETIPGDPSATVRLVLQGTVRGAAERAVVDLNGAADGADFSTSTFGGGPAVSVVAADATVTRFTTSANLTGATVTLADRPDGADEGLAAGALPDGFTSSYDPATGVLRITGTGSTAVYQDILRTVTYQNTRALATPGARAVTVVARDALNESQVRTSTVTVAPPAAFPAADDGTVQASQRRFLSVTFSTVVSVQPGAFTLTRLGAKGGEVGVDFVTFEFIPGQTTAVIFFNGTGSVYGLADGTFALADGNYRLGLDGSLITTLVGGVAVDADGDGLSGGVGAFDFYRYFGDGTGDRAVGDDDLALFDATFGLTSADAGFLSFFDADGDGDVDADDRAEFDLRYGTSLPPK